MRADMSKSRKRSIFGMTFAQLMVLGCLAVVATGTIFGGFIFISSSSTPGSFAAPLTPIPTFSVQPTIAPDQAEEAGVSPTATLILSAEQIPPDWKQYSASTIEIQVPPQFVESANVAITRQERIDFYRGQGFEFLAQRLENDTFDYRFWFDYPAPDTVAYVTHIIVKADVLPTSTLDEYVDEAYGAGLQGFQVTNRQEFDIENLQARRIVLGANLNALSISVAEYVITDEANLWIISCGSNLDEFFTWLPQFDQVARSFRLLY
jgi:hypothetical protein